MGEERIGERRQQRAIEILQEYLTLGGLFETPPEVYLELITDTPRGKEHVGPRDVAVATAFQCYAPKPIFMRPRGGENAQKVADGVLDSPHHTTRLHYYVTWLINGISRQALHDILHYTAFYNSEQQSQRYVEVLLGRFLVPTSLSVEQRARYIEAATFANQAYFELFEILEPVVLERVRAMYPTKWWEIASTRKKLEEKSLKLTYEIARYAVPISQQSTLYHTLSEIQLLRLFHASQLPNFSPEARYAVAKMIQAVAEYEPSILDDLRKPVAIERQDSFNERMISAGAKGMDQLLGNRTALMIPTGDLRRSLIFSARNVLGWPDLSDEEVLGLLLDPAKNKLLADIYEVGMFDPLTNVLRQAPVQSLTKLSYIIDQQRQRHRTTPGAAPSLLAIYGGGPDYITPMLVRQNPSIQERYSQIMTRIYENVELLINSGIPKEWALMLLPNAHTIRLVETGGLFDWFHRFKLRLCFTAQEEIFFNALDQVEQILEILPEAAEIFFAPCGIRQRSGDNPKCTEKDRWCGVHMWEAKLSEYRTRRLI